jgi:hypothetical protein
MVTGAEDEGELHAGAEGVDSLWCAGAGLWCAASFNGEKVGWDLDM